MVLYVLYKVLVKLCIMYGVINTIYNVCFIIILECGLAYECQYFIRPMPEMSNANPQLQSWTILLSGTKFTVINPTGVIHGKVPL